MSNIAQGDYLKSTRERLRRSQRWLAEASGLSIRTVMRAERGAELSSESLIAICAALDVDVQRVPVERGHDGEAEPVVDDEAEGPGAVAATGPARRRSVLPVVLNLVCAIVVVCASVAVYYVWLLDRLGPVGGEYWERQQLAHVVYQGHFVDLLEASAGRPVMRSTVVSMVRGSGGIYPDCPGSAEGRLRDRFEWGARGCVIRGESPTVVESPDGTTVYAWGPISAQLGTALASSLRARPGRRIETRFVPPAAGEAAGVPGEWFEPNVSLERPDPKFPEGGTIEVRIQKAGGSNR